MASGAKTNQRWGLETSFGVEATNVNKSFGNNVEISSLELDNALTPRRGTGTRNMRKVAPGMFRGALSIKFDLVEPWVLRLITGGYAKAGSTTLTLTFSEADILPSFTTYDHIKTDSGSNLLRKYLGCVVIDATIDAVQNDVVTVSLSVAFADVKEATTTQEALIPTGDVLTFAQASWEKAGAGVTLTESVSISINQNAELKPYLGSRIAQRARFGNREYEVSTSKYLTDNTTYLNELYGGTAAAGPSEAGPNAKNYSLLVGPEAGQVGAAYTFAFTGGYVSKRSEPKREGEDVIEEVTLIMTSLTITAVTDQAEPTW